MTHYITKDQIKKLKNVIFISTDDSIEDYQAKKHFLSGYENIYYDPDNFFIDEYNNIYIIYNINGDYNDEVTEDLIAYLKANNINYYLLKGGINSFKPTLTEKRNKLVPPLQAMSSPLLSKSMSPLHSKSMSSLSSLSSKSKYKPNTSQPLVSRLSEEKNIKPSYIIDNIYIGSLNDVENEDLIKEYNFKYIINMCMECNYYLPNNVIYLKIPWIDNVNQNLHYDILKIIFDIIDNAVSKNENILIHCFAGKSRSVSVVMAYLIIRRDLSYDDAYDLLTSKRNIDINMSFLGQLITIYKNNIKF